jgi:hypothetical protein
LRRNGQALEQLPLLSETPTASESSQSDGLACPSFPTLGGLLPTPVANDDNKSPAAHMAMKARMKGGERHTITSLNVRVKAGFGSCPVGSLANLIPLQESVKRLLTIVTSGPNLPVSFARFARDGSSQRMFPVSSTPNLDGSLVRFSGTWPTWGIARDGACGELPTLERCTAANESSSWPTPTVRRFEQRDAGRAADSRDQGREDADAARGVRQGRPSGDEGHAARAVKMWPTPTANEDAAGRPTGKMQPMLGNHPDVRRADLAL